MWPLSSSVRLLVPASASHDHLPMLLLALMAAATSAPAPHSLSGSWACAPYEIQTDQFTAVVTSRYDYSASGVYTSDSTAEYTFGEAKVTIEATFDGRWELDGALLRLMADDVTVSAVSPPIFSPSEGAELLRGGTSFGTWYDYRVVQSNPRLVFERVSRPKWLVTEQFSCEKA